MTKTNIIIRDARIEDQEAIKDVVVSAYSEYEVGMGARWEEYKQTIIDSVYDDGPIARIIAELDGEIVGSLLLFSSSAQAYGRPDLEINSPIIRLLAVSKKTRGRGVATKLIKECIKRSADLGADSLYLHSSDLMQTAINLYEYLGFERVIEKEMYKEEIVVKCFKLNIK